MANYDMAALSLKMIAPTNELIVDNSNLPGAYVRIPQMKLSDVLTGGTEQIHPAFIVNGEAVPEIFIGKYQGSQNNNKIYSLPCADPVANINSDNFVARCKSKGAGHHCITYAEWGLLANWCRKNGKQPLGNNNYGKDISETNYIALPTSKDGNNTARVATGTGPITWSHNGSIDGIWDLTGNVWEWISGIRLVKGELQVIPDNNAALADTNESATSTQWKAIKAAATSWNDLYIAPNGSGTTSGSVKLDWVSNHWQWATSITSSSTSVRNADFALTTSSGLSNSANLFLQAIALLPEIDADDSTYANDRLFANNGNNDMLCLCGGAWNNGIFAGIFSRGLNNTRSLVRTDCGGRPAFVKL